MAKLPKLTIDPELQSLLPPLSDGEYLALEKAIVQDGRALNPLIVWAGHGIILDGHHRYTICTEHDLPFTIVEKAFLDKQSAAEWMVSHQDARRNWTAEQRKYALGRLMNMSKHSHGGSRKSSGETVPSGASQKSESSEESAKNTAKSEEISKAQNEPLKTEGDTAGKLAESHGVARETVKRAAKFAEAVDKIADVAGDEIRSVLISGQIKVTDADVAKLAALPAAQVKKSAKAITSGKAKSVNQAIKESAAAPANPAAKADDGVDHGVDPNGVKIPSAAALTMEQNKELESLARQVTAIVKRLDVLYETCAGGYLPMNRIQADAKNLTDAIRGAKFNSICPNCEGHGCKRCHDSGWVTKAVERNLPRKGAA